MRGAAPKAQTSFERQHLAGPMRPSYHGTLEVEGHAWTPSAPGCDEQGSEPIAEHAEEPGSLFDSYQTRARRSPKPRR